MLARMDDAPPSVPPRPRGSWWRRATRLPLALMLTSLLAALGIVQLSFQLINTGYRTLSWSQQQRETLARIEGLERDIRILQDAKLASNDPNYLRQLARCQGFVGADEQIIVSPSAPDTPGENCQIVRLP